MKETRDAFFFPSHFVDTALRIHFLMDVLKLISVYSFMMVIVDDTRDESGIDYTVSFDCFFIGQKCRPAIPSAGHSSSSTPFSDMMDYAKNLWPINSTFSIRVSIR